ncbi:hypothetical protein QYE76_060097 [Lolium multiflorum]|uniref:Uncharacterized protein n=1 Tax=Lolium multiflorum TaxID=4521 RepID=A0AAD8RYE9_LOLMU|nr:hypothetical protein QYE76_060097 [Lolium multiflorum]
MRRLKQANAEEIEAAAQHEEIEATNAEIEAAAQHEEIEAANAGDKAVQHEEIEPMDREQREQMDVEWLQPMSPVRRVNIFDMLESEWI